MKKTSSPQAAPVASLTEIGTRWRADAQAEEAAVLALLREQAAEAVAAGQAVLPVYAEVERQHGRRLREDQTEFKSDVYARSRWVGDLETVRDQGAAILAALTINPPAITKQLAEIAGMTVQYARSHRLRLLCEELGKNADTGQQLAQKVAEYDDALARLRTRLEAERPDLSPRPTLASAGGDVPPSGPRRAVSGLSDG
jgi:hypothetical protein